MKVVRNVLALALVLAMALPLMGAEKGRQKGERRARAGAQERSQVLPKELLADLQLTDEQKAKLKELEKEFAPKFKEVKEKLAGILTDEQKKARDEAQKAAKQAGKEPKEVREAVAAAVQLTEEQKAKQAEVQKELAALNRQAREKFMELLTPEQKEKVKAKMEKARGEGRKRGEKKAAQ